VSWLGSRTMDVPPIRTACLDLVSMTLSTRRPCSRAISQKRSGYRCVTSQRPGRRGSRALPRAQGRSAAGGPERL